MDGLVAPRRLLTFGAVLAASLAAQPADAAQKLVVLELATPPGLIGIGAKLSQDVVDAAKRDPAYAVQEPLAVEAALGPEKLKKAQTCSPRPDCVVPYLAAMGDRAIIGSLDRSTDSYLVSINLVDLKSGRTLSSINRSVLIASRRLQSDIGAALPGLLKGEAEATAKFDVRTTSPGATVTFDGAVSGKTPVVIETKPGKHALKVTKENYLPVERFVTVEAGKTELVQLTLTPVPGAVIDEVAEKKAADKAAEEQASALYIPPATWIAGGVAVAAAGAGAFFGSRVASANNKAVDGDGDGLLDMTRTEASAAKRDALIANASFGVAAASAAAGVLFLVLLDEPEPVKADKSLTLEPGSASLSLLPGGAAVALAGRF